MSRQIWPKSHDCHIPAAIPARAEHRRVKPTLPPRFKILFQIVFYVFQRIAALVIRTLRAVSQDVSNAATVVKQARTTTRIGLSWIGADTVRNGSTTPLNKCLISML